MTNRYYRRSKISEARFRRLPKLFAMDLSATDAAELTGLSVRSTNDIYPRLRQRIARECELSSPVSGEVEVDESHFGPRRVRGKRGRGTGGYAKYLRVNHESNDFARGKSHVNGIESFKRRACPPPELRQASARQVERRAGPHILPAPQGVRLPLQRSTQRPLQGAAGYAPTRPDLTRSRRRLLPKPHPYYRP